MEPFKVLYRTFSSKSGGIHYILKTVICIVKKYSTIFLLLLIKRQEH